MLQSDVIARWTGWLLLATLSLFLLASAPVLIFQVVTSARANPPVTILALAGVLAAICLGAIVVAIIPLNVVVRFAAMMIVSFLIIAPAWIGYALALSKLGKTTLASPGNNQEPIWLLVSPVPLLIVALGCALHGMRIHFGMTLTKRDETAIKPIPPFQRGVEYLAVFVAIGIGVYVAQLAWPGMGPNEANWPLIGIVSVSAVLVGGLILLPVALLTINLPRLLLIPFVVTMFVLCAVASRILFPLFGPLLVSGFRNATLEDLLLIAVPLLGATSLIMLYLFALRLLGLKLRMPKYQPRPQKPAAVAVHPLDR